LGCCLIVRIKSMCSSNLQSWSQATRRCHSLPFVLIPLQRKVDCLRSGWNAGTLRHGPQNPTPNRSRTHAINARAPPIARSANEWPLAGQPQPVPRSKSQRLESKEGKIGGQGLALWLALGLLHLHSLPFHMHHCPALLPGSTHCSCSPALLHIASSRLRSPSFPLFPLAPSLLRFSIYAPSAHLISSCSHRTTVCSYTQSAFTALHPALSTTSQLHFVRVTALFHSHRTTFVSPASSNYPSTHPNP
jgi:hypothetical protein